MNSSIAYQTQQDVTFEFTRVSLAGYQVNPLDLSPQYASVITGVGRIGTIGAIASTFIASQVVEDHVS